MLERLAVDFGLVRDSIGRTSRTFRVEDHRVKRFVQATALDAAHQNQSLGGEVCLHRVLHRMNPLFA